jgi:hypothetical protein
MSILRERIARAEMEKRSNTEFTEAVAHFGTPVKQRSQRTGEMMNVESVKTTE